MTRYLQTFSRHKLALLLPVVIALVMSGWYAVSQPSKYEGATTLWFDTSVPAQSSLDNPVQYGTPADNAQQVLQELLTTRQFLVKVGHRGPLAQYLNTHRPVSKGPSALLSKIIHLGHSSAGRPAVDDEIMAILGHAFAVSKSGPQVLEITMTAPDPSYIPGTLKALAAEYNGEVTAVRASRDAASAAYLQTQVAKARQTLDTANATLSNYQKAHPGVLPDTDPTYAQLAQVASQAQTDYTSAQNDYQQASIVLQNLESPTAFHVIDPAVSAFKQSNKKHMIFIVIAGLVAGLVISLLALSALTSLDKSARRQEDINSGLGLDVVATIQQLPGRRRALNPPGKVSER